MVCRPLEEPSDHCKKCRKVLETQWLLLYAKLNFIGRGRLGPSSPQNWMRTAVAFGRVCKGSCCPCLAGKVVPHGTKPTQSLAECSKSRGVYRSLNRLISTNLRHPYRLSLQKASNGKHKSLLRYAWGRTLQVAANCCTPCLFMNQIRQRGLRHSLKVNSPKLLHVCLNQVCQLRNLWRKAASSTNYIQAMILSLLRPMLPIREAIMRLELQDQKLSRADN